MRAISLSKTLVLSLALLAAGSGHANAIAQQGAQDVVKKATTDVISALESKRDSLKANPSEIYSLVDELILPHFDFERMSYYILGAHWQKATAAQKQAFMDEFKHLLVNTYATALLEYSSEEEVVFLQPQVNKAGTMVIVPTEIRQPTSGPLRVVYRMYKNEGKWKIIDIQIGDISLVVNYRTDFAGQIRRDGFDGLIKTLQSKNRPAATQAGTGNR